MSAVVARPCSAPSLQTLTWRMFTDRRTPLRLLVMLLLGFVPVFGQVVTLGWLSRTARHIRRGDAGLPEVRPGHDIWSAGLTQLAIWSTHLVLGGPLALLVLPARMVGWLLTVPVVGAFAVLAWADPASAVAHTESAEVVAHAMAKGAHLLALLPAFALSLEAMRLGAMGEMLPLRRHGAIRQGIRTHKRDFIAHVLGVFVTTGTLVGALALACFHSIWALFVLPVVALAVALVTAIAIARWDHIVGGGPDMPG